MPKRNKITIEVNRAQAYQIIRAFRGEKTGSTLANDAFAIVEDAIYRYDEAQRKEQREKEDKKLGR